MALNDVIKARSPLLRGACRRPSKLTTAPAQTNATGNRLSPRAPLSKAWYAGAQSPRRSARGAAQSKAGESGALVTAKSGPAPSKRRLTIHPDVDATSNGSVSLHADFPITISRAKTAAKGA